MGTFARITLKIAIFVAMAFIAWRHPVIGLTLISVAVSLYISSRLEIDRLLAERRYFYNTEGTVFDRTRVFPQAVWEAVTRAFGVGAAAIFLLPARLNPAGTTDELGIYIAQFADFERVATALVFLGSTAVSLLIANFFNHRTAGRGLQWSFYKLSVVFGLTFSFLMWGVQTVMPNQFYSFDKPAIIANAYSWTANKVHCNKLQARGEVASNNGGVLNDWFVTPLNNVRLVYDGCLSNRTPFLVRALASVSVIDEFLDKTISDAVAGAAESIGLPRWLTANFAAIFLSSNIVQGFVLSIYVSLSFMFFAQSPPRPDHTV